MADPASPDKISPWGAIHCRLDLLQVAAQREDKQYGSPKALAALFGVSYPTIIRLLNDQATAYGRSFLASVCAAWNIPLLTLLEFWPPSDLRGPRALVIPPRLPQVVTLPPHIGDVRCTLKLLLDDYADAFGERPTLDQLNAWTGIKTSRLDDLLHNRVQRYEPDELSRLITFFSRAASKGRHLASLDFLSKVKDRKYWPNTVQLILEYETEEQRRRRLKAEREAQAHA